jgi:hypothetical protein
MKNLFLIFMILAVSTCEKNLPEKHSRQKDNDIEPKWKSANLPFLTNESLVLKTFENNKNFYVNKPFAYMSRRLFYPLDGTKPGNEQVFDFKSGFEFLGVYYHSLPSSQIGYIPSSFNEDGKMKSFNISKTTQNEALQGFYAHYWIEQLEDYLKPLPPNDKKKSYLVLKNFLRDPKQSDWFKPVKMQDTALSTEDFKIAFDNIRTHLSKASPRDPYEVSIVRASRVRDWRGMDYFDNWLAGIEEIYEIDAKVEEQVRRRVHHISELLENKQFSTNFDELLKALETIVFERHGVCKWAAFKGLDELEGVVNLFDALEPLPPNPTAKQVSEKLGLIASMAIGYYKSRQLEFLVAPGNAAVDGNILLDVALVDILQLPTHNRVVSDIAISEGGRYLQYTLYESAEQVIKGANPETLVGFLTTDWQIGSIHPWRDFINASYKDAPEITDFIAELPGTDEYKAAQKVYDAFVEKKAIEAFMAGGYFSDNPGSPDFVPKS